MSDVLSEAAAAERRRIKRLQLEEQLRQLDEEEAAESYARSSRPANIGYINTAPSGPTWTGRTDQHHHNNNTHSHTQYDAGYDASEHSYPTGAGSGAHAADVAADQYYNGGSTQRNAYAHPVQASSTSVYRSRQDSGQPTSRSQQSQQQQQQTLPVPSKEQVNDYLIQHMNHRHGLMTGWHIDGVVFDVDELFSTVVRAGGSSVVTGRSLWPVVATHLGVAAVPGSDGMRSSISAGDQFKEFFLQHLGGLEILWDQTKGPSARSGPGQAQTSSQDARRTVLTAQTRQAAAHPQQQQRNTTVNHRSNAHVQAGGMSQTSSQNHSRNATTHSQQAPPTTYWQNDQYYGSANTGTSRLASIEPQQQPGATSSRVQQPYSSSERYTAQPSQTFRHVQGSINYRSNQSQMPQNMPTTVAPSDLRLHQPKPSRPAPPPQHYAATETAPPDHRPPTPPSSAPLPPPAAAALISDTTSKQQKKRVRVSKPKASAASTSEAVDVAAGVSAPNASTTASGSALVPPQPSGAAPGKVPKKRKSKIKLGPDGLPLPPRPATGVTPTQSAPLNDAQAPSSNILEPTASNANIPPTHTSSQTPSKMSGVTPIKKPVRSLLRKPNITPGTPVPSGAVDEFSSFADLVHSGKLPLPPAGPGLEIDRTGGPQQQYAERCQELRVAVTLTRGEMGYRDITMAEFGFWNRLVVILKKNSAIIIPGSEHYALHGEAPWVMPNPQPGSGYRRPAGRPKLPRDENGNMIRPPPKLNADGTPVVKPPKLNADGTPVVRQRAPRLDANGNPLPPKLNPDGTPLIRIRKRKRTGEEESASRVRGKGMGRPRTTGNGTDNAFGIAVDMDPIPKAKYTIKAVLAAQQANSTATIEKGTEPGAVLQGKDIASQSKTQAQDGDSVVGNNQGDKGTPALVSAESQLASALTAAQAASKGLAAAVEQTPTSQAVPSTAPKSKVKGVPAAMLGRFSIKSAAKPRPIYFVPSPKKAPTTTALSGYDASPMRSISLSSGPGTLAKLRRADFVMWSPKKFAPQPVVVMSAMMRGQHAPNRRAPRPEGAPRLGRPPGPRALALASASQPATTTPRRGRPPGRSSLGQSSSQPQPQAGPSRPIATLPRRAYLDSVEISSLPRSQLSRFAGSQITPSAAPRRAAAAPATAPTPSRLTTRGVAAAATPTGRHTRALGPSTPAQLPSSLPLAHRTRPRGATIDEAPASLPLARTRRRPASPSIGPQDNAAAGPSRRALRSQRSPSVEVVESPPRKKRARATTASAAPTDDEPPRRGRSRPSPAPVARQQPQKQAQKQKPKPRPVTLIQPGRLTRSQPLVLGRGMRYVTKARKPVLRIPLAATRAAITAPAGRTLPKSAPLPKLVLRPVQIPQRVVLSVPSSPEPMPKAAPESLVGRGMPIVEIPLSRKRKPKPTQAEGMPMNRARVVLRISRSRRAELISRGYYDPFRDDCSDDDEYEQRRAHPGLRPVKLSRGVKAYHARPSVPEALPLRFLARAGPGIIEPWRTVLDETTLLRRASEQRCGWKGCDAVLASEDLLRRHVVSRRHAAQGKFQGGGSTGKQPLYRCHWYGCEEPCFEQEGGLEQHIMARHVSRVLACPYYGCDLTSPTVSHLARHVMKHHDDPEDEPRPLADLSTPIEPDEENLDDDLPTLARTDELTTPSIMPSIHRNTFRNDWVRQKVADRCIAGDDPIMRVLHPVHMLEHAEDPDVVLANAPPPIASATISDAGDDADEDDMMDGEGGPEHDNQFATAEAEDDMLFDELLDGDADMEMDAIAQGELDLDLGDIDAEEQWEDEVEDEEADPQRALRLAIEGLANGIGALDDEEPSGDADAEAIDPELEDGVDLEGIALGLGDVGDLDLDVLDTPDGDNGASGGLPAEEVADRPDPPSTSEEAALKSSVLNQGSEEDNHGGNSAPAGNGPSSAENTDAVVDGAVPTAHIPNDSSGPEMVSEAAVNEPADSQLLLDSTVTAAVQTIESVAEASTDPHPGDSVAPQPVSIPDDLAAIPSTGDTTRPEAGATAAIVSHALAISVSEEVPPLTAGLSTAATTDEAPLGTPLPDVTEVPQSPSAVSKPGPLDDLEAPLLNDANIDSADPTSSVPG